MVKKSRHIGAERYVKSICKVRFQMAFQSHSVYTQTISVTTGAVRQLVGSNIDVYSPQNVQTYKRKNK